MKQAFTRGRPNRSTLKKIETANEIIAAYQADGYTLTVRQLYYQHVARDLIPNTEQSYKRFANLINDGRLRGLIDWDAIEDRTRSLAKLATWATPGDIIETAALQYRIDLWQTQAARIEVWIEKEALAGVIERACSPLRVPYLSCRGYTSQSEMYTAGARLRRWVEAGQSVIVLHLGDHDPSGVDMSRDIRDRLHMFMGETSAALTFDRIALTEEQVKEHKPPPNPAKESDSRHAGYAARYGTQSWELDALPPDLLVDLIQTRVDEYRDMTRWRELAAIEERHKEQLSGFSRSWDEFAEFDEPQR